MFLSWEREWAMKGEMKRQRKEMPFTPSMVDHI
jgi:hypothetical protein